MGSENFFKKAVSGPKIGGISNLNLEARAGGASNFAGRAGAAGASKDLGAAMGINKSPAPLKKSDRSAAYPKGPKGV